MEREGGREKAEEGGSRRACGGRSHKTTSAHLPPRSNEHSLSTRPLRYFRALSLDKLKSQRRSLSFFTLRTRARRARSSTEGARPSVRSLLSPAPAKRRDGQRRQLRRARGVQPHAEDGRRGRRPPRVGPQTQGVRAAHVAAAGALRRGRGLGGGVGGALELGGSGSGRASGSSSISGSSTISSSTTITRSSRI